MTTPRTRCTTTRKVPAQALYFAADVSVDEKAALDSATTPPAADDTPPPPVPVTIRARTSGEAFQGYWGRCVHDLAGYIPPSHAIPLNLNHDRASLIGVVPTAPQIDGDELVAQGQLVPFTDEDHASEIIYKGSQGVPYQASIQLDLATLVVEEVEPNLTVEVNGQSFVGPLSVFRQWGLEAISIVPFGADPNTSVEFARGSEVDVRCFTAQGSPTMADAATSTTDEQKPEPSAFAAWAKKTFGMDESTMTDEQKPLFQAAFEAATKPEEKPADETKPEENPAEEKPADGDFAATAKRMLSDFGSQGAVWAAEGKSYDAAAGLFRAAQTARLAELETKLAEAERKANFHRGHGTPAAFQPPVDGQPPVENKTDFSGHSDARKKLIDTITRRFATSVN